MAEEHKTLKQALVAFQAETPKLAKDGVNPHFSSKFTPLDTIVETIQPLLAKHGLAWAALPSSDEHGQPTLTYMLIHGPSGEELRGTMPLMLAKNDPQGQGSGLTYARRYAISAVLNLVSDADDDGNAATRGRQRQSQKRDAPENSGGSSPDPFDPKPDDLVSAADIARLRQIAAGL